MPSSPTGMASDPLRTNLQRRWTWRASSSWAYHLNCGRRQSLSSSGGASLDTFRTSTHSSTLHLMSLWTRWRGRKTLRVRLSVSLLLHVLTPLALDDRLLLLLVACDCPAQRQVTGEKGPGSKLGCEK